MIFICTKTLLLRILFQVKEYTYSMLPNVENNFWWYVAYSKIILSKIKKHIKQLKHPSKYIDASCDTGKYMNLFQGFRNV